jgi:hypothetical protein
MTLAALLTIFDPQLGPWTARALDWGMAGDNGAGVFIAFGLWLVLLGATFTTLNRTRRALAYLRKR